MKEKSTERIAAALMGDLLVRLAGREKVKTMLGTLDDAAAEELIPELVQGIEKTIEWHYLKFLLRLREKQSASSTDQPLPEQSAYVSVESASGLPSGAVLPPPPVPELPPLAEVRTPRPSIAETARPTVVPSPSLAPIEPPPVIAPTPVVSVPTRTPAEPRRVIAAAPAVAPPAPVERPSVVARTPAFSPPTPVERPPVSAPAPTVPEIDKGLPEPKEQEEPEEMLIHRAPHQRVEFDDDDVVYLHGVSVVPLDENPDAGPFMLEEKGIEDREFAFACDFEGMRFYLSKLRELANTVSKGGVLLLGKPESLRLRRIHESILNDLRQHDVLLPFEFGTVARGKSSFLARLDNHIVDLRAALKELLCTTWWNLSVYVLDAHMAQFLGSEGPASRRERGSGRANSSGPTPTKRSDVKLLDRILTREKKIAESVHEELSQVADRSDVDMMIGLGAGSSEDWKLILKASYEVPSGRLRAFNRAVTDLQYQHLQAELIFSLAGAQEYFSFPKNA